MHSIRPYQPSDRPAVIELLRLNTPAYFSQEEEADLEEYLDNKIELYYVIEVEGQIVGCGGINFSEEKNTGIISWDMLDPHFQGRSLGGKLLQYRIERLNEFPAVSKIIVRTSQLAYKFYEKGGFKLINIVEDHWAKGYHLYQMEYEG